MEIIELNKEHLIYFLLNSNPKFQGQFGILTVIGDKIYKINYKMLINTYLSKDEHNLDEEVESLLQIESILKNGIYDVYSYSQKFERLRNTRINNLISGVLSYKGLYIGIQMNYYEQYIKFSDSLEILDDISLNYCLEYILELLNDFLENDIVPKDIKEDNILVNPKTLDIVIIDLDGIETVYGPKNYILNYPYTKEVVMKSYEEMKLRLLATRKNNLSVFNKIKKK